MALEILRFEKEIRLALGQFLFTSFFCPGKKMVGIGRGIEYIWSFQPQTVTILFFGSFEVRKTFTIHGFISQKTGFSDSEFVPSLVPPKVSTWLQGDKYRQIHHLVYTVLRAAQ